MVMMIMMMTMMLVKQSKHFIVLKRSAGQSSSVTGHSAFCDNTEFRQFRGMHDVNRAMEQTPNIASSR